MKIEEIKIFGALDAIRGMRNPLNSWAKLDSTFKFSEKDGSLLEAHLGENDLKLARTLTSAGTPHRKFLRQIYVSMDITAPMYWWAEMDTYKIATTRNSCSVQHKGSSRDFAVEDFTFDGIEGNDLLKNEEKGEIKTIIDIVNKYRRLYVETKDYTYFRLMRQFMPSGYNYKATWSGNMETLANIYEWRRHHKLKEWHVLCDEIEKMPIMMDLIDKIDVK